MSILKNKSCISASILLSIIFLLNSCEPFTESSAKETEGEYLLFKPDKENEEKFWHTIIWTHPDAKTILKGSDFSSWLMDQNTETKEKIKTKSYKVAIELLDRYKAETYYSKALKMSGSRQNIDKMTELLRQSVMYGNMKASFHLGELYRKGDLVEKNRRKAFRYLTKARLAGNKKARYSLQTMGFLR